MTELMSLHGWGYPSMRMGSSDSPKNNSNNKKLSPSPSRSPGPSPDSHDGNGNGNGNARSPSPSSNKTVFRARSSNALADMASAAASSFRPSFSPSSSSAVHEENSLNTIKDPRTASTSDLSSTTATNHHHHNNPSPRHPDLSNEVATLSDKLIQAINNQGMLDATLSSTRQELDAARAKVEALEQKCREHEQQLSSGSLVKTHEVELERSLMRDAVEDEKSRRVTAEKDKKGIEQELENLTAALFEEANKMVAAAKKEREAVDRKNEQLRAQIKDTELLVASHQEQLAELKATMQQMHHGGDREDTDSRTTNPSSTAPASPAAQTSQHDSIGRLLDAMNLSPATPGSGGDISPAPSTSFAHLIKSVCRTDIPAYEDFRCLLHQAAAGTNPHSRAGSASSYGGLSVRGLGNFSVNNQSSPNLSNTNGRASSTTSSSSTTQTPTPSGLTASPREPQAPSAPLKETRFYKRVLTEDIEPALRLDAAPSISWLTRRSVLSSICEGGLMIEPMPQITMKYAFPCSLCGERRKGSENSRLHRFKTSDNDSAQRYPLCMVCLEKMRACCDFVGYLRMIVDGHVRAADEEDEREAWDETVRLRERLFWSRIGGGVVPAFAQKKDPEERDERDSSASMLGRGSRDDPVAQNDEPRLDVRDVTAAADPFVSKAKRVSIGNRVISISGVGAGRSSDDAEEEEVGKGDDNGDKEAGRAEPSHPASNDTDDIHGSASHAKSSSVSSVITSKSEKDAEPALVAVPTSDDGNKQQQQQEDEENKEDDDASATEPSSHTANGDIDPSGSHAKTSSVSSVTTSKSSRRGTDPTLKVAIPASFEL